MITPPSLHVGIIMDGNGRWATRRRLPRGAGHRAGADTARALVEAARDQGVTTLTLYAFSSDNWQRPKHEVNGIFSLVHQFAKRELRRLQSLSVRLIVTGRRDRLDRAALRTTETAERETQHCTGMTLRLAVDYSSRDMMALAAGDLAARGIATPSREDFAAALARVASGPGEIADQPTIPDIDLLIRTGGEQRLSDFCLWELAYAELLFTDKLWPDFTPVDLDAALSDFRLRDRRFGRIDQSLEDLASLSADGPRSAALGAPTP